jgi:signal transduction histidine kinase
MEDQIATLRHDLANPLAALLAEVQLLLLGDTPMDDSVRETLKQVEQLALRMRSILRATQEPS